MYNLGRLQRHFVSAFIRFLFGNMEADYTYLGRYSFKLLSPLHCSKLGTSRSRFDVDRTLKPQRLPESVRTSIPTYSSRQAGRQATSDNCGTHNVATLLTTLTFGPNYHEPSPWIHLRLLLRGFPAIVPRNFLQRYNIHPHTEDLGKPHGADLEQVFWQKREWIALCH